MLLQAKQVMKQYPNTAGPVVKTTSITIERGTIHVIRGKSGSGKSTILSMLGGMEPPTTGEVIVDRNSLYQLSDKKQAKIRGEQFGFVFQSFHLVPEMTVEENIVLPLRFTKRAIHKEKVHALAEQLGIVEKLSVRPAFLSGGQQQRVAIARSMIAEPKIIFADEPTGNLDQETSKVVIEQLTKLCKKNKQALVVVTHEKSLIKSPDNLYWMEDGVLKEVTP
ncbi:ABC transporter ATP-binding protein [Salipaludibacillus sp. LMS25]|jgi:putative ABC transport system ATP-binding protein|uniref:ABC transporter ATP-binding protein n=1 Tax=Salipaludibacillus sp. LMS25 TaxID=2924031 RepID=UPI0020D0B6BD|nr:ABC transporter ATP-binding protein [Salipaludibacillus sp. LMS25]UTR15758.1 ABC transporter ATP-binding protein [Salipaludibacillus sp. LMS25]